MPEIDFYTKILRFLANTTKANITSSDTLDESSTEIDLTHNMTHKETHSDYLWLLVIDLLIFIGLTATCYSSSQKLIQKQNSSNSIAEDFKPKFLKGLIYANGVRVVSLIFIIVLENRSGNNPASWFNYFCHIVPAFVFVSAYMYLVTFLADLYYTSLDYNNHVAKPVLLLVVISAYIILAVMSLITFGMFYLILAAQLFKSFAYSSEFLMAVVYAILGSMIIYYGNKIANLFSTKNFQSNNDTGQKLQMLSLSIGGLFLLKSFCGLLTAFHFFGDVYPVSIGANVWDFLWFLVTEIGPTVVFIFIARKKDTVQPRDSTRESNNFVTVVELNERENTTYDPPSWNKK